MLGNLFSVKMLKTIYISQNLKNTCLKSQVWSASFSVSKNSFAMNKNIHRSFLLHKHFDLGLRSLHSSPNFSGKEPSKIEETVKVLKDEAKEVKKKLLDQKEVPHLPEKSELSSTSSAAPKRSLGKRIIDEVIHYYHGFRLLFIDTKISTRLVMKVLRGGELTRREHRQLVRTVSDLFRLVPFSIFILVPFMELLLPFFIKFFPAMLPSTFQTTSEKELKFKQQLKVKIEMAKFLQDTLEELATVSKGETHSKEAKDFALFFEKVRKSGQQPSTDEILHFSKLFEDEITLDSLSRPKLIALCRLLELQPIGTNNFLQFQLRMRLRTLKTDDVVIRKEGIENLTISELQAACRARGMRALGMPEERLRSQLQQWLELSLDAQIPPSLLLLSRALYLPESLPASDKLKATISVLPDIVATEAKLKIGELEGKVDNKTKLELIRQEEEAIKKEAEEIEQDLLNQKKIEDAEKAAALSSSEKEILKDKAESLIDRAEEVEKVVQQIDGNELSKEDFANLEDAIENISIEKKKLLIEKEEIEDLKVEMEEYKQDVEELKDVAIVTGHKELKQSKAAERLSKKVNKMISKMDYLLDGLSQEKQSIQQQIDDKMQEGVKIGKERDDIISINELVLAIRRIQKVSDDTKLQRIADVLAKMDVDHDGSVEVDHVLKVIELLGKDNVKVSVKQMEEIIDLLMKEDLLELEEKAQKQMDSKEKDAASKENAQN